jgi:phosphatidylserine/phosphatidylglycerophosphate/cardiolipin synthase-like enzyme
VEGIFERVGSETQFAELRPMLCAGIPVRQDGNRFVLHHKVFIIDNTTVLAGSFNFSANATSSNDENLIFIQDPALAAEYTAEFERRWAEAITPTNITCQ